MSNPADALMGVLVRQGRIVGAQRMQTAALRWAVANQQVLSQPSIDGLIAALEEELAKVASA